jgi:hypothetical protein
MVHRTLVPHHQPSIVTHPPKAPFDLPPVAVVGPRAARPPALGALPGSPSEGGNRGLDASPAQIPAEGLAIVGAVRDQLRGPRAWPPPPAGHRRQNRFSQRASHGAGRCPHADQSAGLGHQRRPSPSSPCRLSSPRCRSPFFRWDETAVQDRLRPFQLALGIELAQQHPPEPLPGAIPGPRAEPTPTRGRRAIYARPIFPGTAGLQHEEDAVECAAIVVSLPAGARWLLWDAGLDSGPLRICQIMSAHAHNVAWAASILK